VVRASACRLSRDRGSGWTVPASVDTVSSCPIRREFVDGFDTP
jgi:hypothetical protein